MNLHDGYVVERMLPQPQATKLKTMKPNAALTLEHPLRLVHRGQVVDVPHVPPTRTLLQVLRDDMGLHSVKEGCAEGDCGACTVVLGELREGEVTYKAVNSCIRLAHSAQGQAVWTAQDLAQDPLMPAACGKSHPVQEALVHNHASQCGFCTPGFAMSMLGMYLNRVLPGQTVDRATAQADLSGNLCRCTGYRPLLDAAQQMGNYPQVPVNEIALKPLLTTASQHPHNPAYLRPTSAQAALQARAQHPKAQVVAGCTDVGLWVTKQHRQFDGVLDLTQVRDWQQIERHPHHIAIGAAVTLQDAFEALAADRPQIKRFTERYAGLPIRNSGTLAGNIANGSPIGDSMPLLMALGAHIVLMHWAGRGSKGRVKWREMPLEDFYIAYRKTQLQPNELLAWVKVPRALPAYHAGHHSGQWMRAYKISKRHDDDISAVCLAVQLDIDKGQVVQARVGAGGVAATPARARRTEAALQGQPWNADTVLAAMHTLREEFSPLSDMRASAAYRRLVLGHLLWRTWLESQGEAHTQTFEMDLAEVQP
jgi:xanthine dehydrogenase small subunit